jgi:hypothetical protein
MKAGDIVANMPLIVRKSFALPYNGGEIWGEQLDSLSDHSELVERKFIEDLQIIARPSSSAQIALQLNETFVTERLASLFISELAKLGPRVQKLAIIGVDRHAKKLLKAELAKSQPKFAVNFFDEIELAKSWLIP